MRYATATVSASLAITASMVIPTALNPLPESGPVNRLTERVYLSSRRSSWIAAGERSDVGFLTAISGEFGSSKFDDYVQHVEKSTANVLVITSVSDTAIQSFQRMPNLRALVLMDTSISDAGLTRFQDFSCLETVGFYSCDVTQEGVGRIQRRMPWVRFEICEIGRPGFVFDATGCISSRFFDLYGRKSWH